MLSVYCISMYWSELGNIIIGMLAIIRHCRLGTLLNFKPIIRPSLLPHMIYKAIIRHCRLLLSLLLAIHLAITFLAIIRQRWFAQLVFKLKFDNVHFTPEFKAIRQRSLSCSDF